MPDLDTLQTFNSLFSQYRFRIPDYQRGYAWGEKEHSELLEDIASLTDGNEHFTGLLVIHENHDPALRVKTRGMVKPIFDVVDGQQRLTTMVILMNEIRRAMLELNTDDMREIAENIQENFLWEPGAGNLKVPKLVMDENNRDFFERNILGMGETNLVGATMKSHDNLMGAHIYFAKKILASKEELKEKYIEWLEGLYGKVAMQLKVMVYRLRTESDAGVVFEGMNSRGKKPNSMDLVKNYLLFAASKLEPDLCEHLSRVINQTWTTIFKQLNAAKMADHEERLLEYHWLTAYNYDRKNWGRKQEKSDHAKEKFKPLITDPNRHKELYEIALFYAQILQNTVVAYTDIYVPKNPGAFQIFDAQPALKKEIVHFSEKLVRIDVMRGFTPLLIAARLRLADDAASYLKIVQLCEKYAFRVFRVARNKTNSSDDVLFRLGNQFFNQRIMLEELIESLQRELHARCNDKTLEREFSLQNPYPWYENNGPRAGLQYMLYEFEERLHGGQDPTINWGAILGNRSIEHILPQNPAIESEWFARFTPDQVEQYKHALGNLTLTLLVDNIKLGRKSFAEKKGKPGQEEYCYANSRLKIECELAGLDDWTPAAIENRQKRLATWAAERWFVPAPPPEPDPTEKLRARVRANGLGNEFEQIYNLAVQLTLIPKAGKNRMSYRSPRDYRWAPIALDTYASGIDLWLRFKYFPLYKNVPATRISEIFDEKDHWWLPPNQIPDFIARLEQLANEVEANKA